MYEILYINYIYIYIKNIKDLVLGSIEALCSFGCPLICSIESFLGDWVESLDGYNKAQPRQGELPRPIQASRRFARDY